MDGEITNSLTNQFIAKDLVVTAHKYEMKSSSNKWANNTILEKAHRGINFVTKV